MKKNISIKIPLIFSLLFLFCVSILIFSCKNKKQVQSEEKNLTGNFDTNRQIIYDKDSLNFYTIYFDTKLGWGFDITFKGEKIIHQPHIPAVNGHQGFKTKQDAISIAGLMMKKLENNIMPPTIKIEELDSLNIFYNK